MYSIKKGDPILIILKDYGILYAGIFDANVEAKDMKRNNTLVTATPEFSFGTKELYFFDDVWGAEDILHIEILDEDIFLYDDMPGYQKIFKAIHRCGYVWILYSKHCMPTKTKKCLRNKNATASRR